MKYIKIISPVVLMFFLGACNTTEVISSYKNDKVAVKNYNQVLVLGIFQQKDRAFRQETENRLAVQLKSMGYNAVTAMDEYGPKAFDKLSEDQIAQQVRSAGYDAVITTAVLDKKKQQNYQPGSVSYQPVGVVYNRFGRYYSTVYDRVYDPGYYTTSTDYILETNLYDVASGELVSSVQTKSYDPSSAGDLAHDNTKRIIQTFNDQGYFKKK